MAQLGFFDADKRLAALSAKGDPLQAIDKLVPWESFRADIEAVVLTPTAKRKSNAGRKSIEQGAGQHFLLDVFLEGLDDVLIGSAQLARF